MDRNDEASLAVRSAPPRIRMPERCPACGGEGTVKPEHTLNGRQVRLTWCCRRCSHSWPITNEERQLTERRVAGGDWRQHSRNDRRRRQAKF